MNTEIVRMNITLPKDLAVLLYKMAGSRKRSRFIAQALRLMIGQMKKAEMDLQLPEGYQAGKNESLIVAEAFEPFDLEGWDDY